jgi:hypothetical protein
MRPLLANTLLSGTFKKVDPVAVLLDLSARGYVRIRHESGRDWTLTLRRSMDDGLAQEDEAVLLAVFGHRKGTTLTDAARRLAAAGRPLRTFAASEVVDLGWYVLRPDRRRVVRIPRAVAILALLAALPTYLFGDLLQAGLVGVALFAGGLLYVVSERTRPVPRTPAGELARSQLIAYQRTLAGIAPTQLPREPAALGGLLPYAVALGLAPKLTAAFSAAGVVASGFGGGGPSYPGWWSAFAGDATRVTTSASSGPTGPIGSFGNTGGSAGGGGGGGGSW